MRDFLQARLGKRTDVDAALSKGLFVDAHGRPWRPEDPYRPNAFVWFHRTRAPESPVPGALTVLYRDDRIVVVDKPHFLATTPRGVHVTESVVAKLRVRLGLDELAPAHRLDRLTSGVLLLTTAKRWRGPYATLFADGLATKTYEALACVPPGTAFPVSVTGRIEKHRDSLQAALVPGEPNSESLIELVEARAGIGRFRLSPRTGKTHQLRLHMASIGAPILNDPLYPDVADVEPNDFSRPLQLVARTLAFSDPIDQSPRRFDSAAVLSWPEVCP